MPPNRFTEGLMEIADSVASTLASNGEIRINVGDATRGTGIDSGIPFWGTDGFLSRPSDPDANGAAQIYFVADGNQRFGVGSRDRRFLAQAGTLDPGDRVVYTKSGTRVFLDESEGTIEARTPGVAILSLGDDEFSIELPGGASLRLTNSGFEVNVPTTPLPSGLTVDAGGIVLSAANLTQDINVDAGKFVSLGLVGGLVRPSVPNIESVNIGPGGGVTVASQKVFAAGA